MAKKHVKQCSLSLTIKEMEIKTTLRVYLTPVTTAIIKNTTNNTNVGEAVRKKEASYTAGGNVVSTTTLENNVEAS
jgi:hypothetical protein